MIFFVFLIYIHLFGGYEALTVPIMPPQPWKAALMARYVIRVTDWVSIATLSTQKEIKGFPFVSLKSSSDGTSNNSTGVPYLYMTELDVTGKDVESDNRVTIMATLAQTNYCENKQFDPQDPRCAKILISGRLLKVEATSQEYEFARDALFEKHPAMKNWPKDHQFYVAKVVPENIEVLDYFGGLKMVTVADYFNANITEWINFDRHYSRIAVIDINAN